MVKSVKQHLNRMDVFGSDEFSTRRMFAMAILVIVAAIGVILWLNHKVPKEVLSIGPYTIGPNPDRTTKWIPMMDAEQIAKTTANNITCSFFLYVDSEVLNQVPVNYDGSYSLEYVMKVGKTMGITINPVKQECIVDILQSDPHTHVGTTVRSRNNAVRSIKVPTLLMAKWNQITITVEGRSIDVYINGKLATSAILDNVPITLFSGMDLNASPDFTGQVCLVQMWPERRSSQQILENYRKNTDVRGRPIVPEPSLSLSGAWERFSKVICTSTGMCGFIIQTGPMEYVEYDFA